MLLQNSFTKVIQTSDSNTVRTSKKVLRENAQIAFCLNVSIMS